MNWFNSLTLHLHEVQVHGIIGIVDEKRSDAGLKYTRPCIASKEGLRVLASPAVHLIDLS